MPRVELLSRVLDVVYRAAMEPEVWPLALREISDAMGSSISGILLQDKATHAIPLVAMDPRSPLAALDEYIAHYGAIDDLRRFAVSKRVGEMITDGMPSFAAITKRSECYNDFYRRWQMGHFAGGSIVSDNRHEGTLVVYRGGSRYSDEQLEMMELLLPHVTRAVEIWTRLGEAAASTQVLGDTLDSLAPGVFLLDATCRIVWMNRTAAGIVESRDGVGIESGELRFRAGAADRSLRAVVRSISSDLLHAKQTHITIPRLSDEVPFLALAAPVATAQIPVAASVMLIVTDRARTRRFLADYLAGVYALTPAETALATAVADGKTLREYASERAVSVQTARAQLKRVLEKTNTHRQAELVQLILTSPAAILRA